MTASPSAGKSTTIAALEERGLDYILGARERGTAVIREVVLKSEKPFTPLLIPGTSPSESPNIPVTHCYSYEKTFLPRALKRKRRISNQTECRVFQGSIRELYAFVIDCLERQEVGLWTARVSRCGFRRRAG